MKAVHTVQHNRTAAVPASRGLGKEGEIVIAGTIKRHSLAGGGKLAEWIP
jgi:hypothetical protein